MFNFFRKTYNYATYFFSRYASYELNYEVYVKSVYRNPSVALAYEKIEGAFTNIEFKTYKKVFKKVGDKKIQQFIPSENRRVNQTLECPSSILSRTDFLEHILFYYMFGGRMLIHRVDGTKTSDLQVFAPNTFEIEFNDYFTEISKIRLFGTKTITGDELKKYFIFKNISPNSRIAGAGPGTTKLEALAVLVDLINFILKHNISLLKNGGKRGGFFRNVDNSKITLKEKEELESKLKEAVEGYQNAGKTHLLPQNIEFVPTDNTPVDLDWISGWEMAHKMISGIMGVPYSMAFDTASTYNNSKEDKVKLYKNTVIPIAKKMAEYLTKVFRDLLNDDEFIWIDFSAIEELRGETMETLKSLDSVSYISINQKREIASELTGIELGKYNHENADKILVDMSKISIEELGAIEPIDEGEE